VAILVTPIPGQPKAAVGLPADHVIGVTGPIPAEYAQSQIIQDHLFWVELCTVLAIALILGLRFRSAGAPLAALACAGTAYVLAVRIVAPARTTTCSWSAASGRRPGGGRCRTRSG